MFSNKLVVAGAIVAATISIGACGGDNKATSPTQPSSTATSNPGAATTGASIAGTVVGITGTPSAAFSTRATGLTVTVTGSNLSSSVDDSGHFELHGVPGGHVELHFSGRSTDARLSLDDVADRDAIVIVVRVDGTTAEIEDNHRQGADNRMEIEGIVAAVNATAGTLRVRDAMVTVPATATIRHGSTIMKLSDILVGDRVHVKGMMTGTMTVASEIEVQNEHAGDDNHGGNPGPNPGPGNGNDDGDDDHGNGRVELSGSVAARSGTCPSLTFTVGTTPVSTSSTTEFKDVSCAALKNGDRVEVKGSRQSPTATVNATRVEKK
jgi:Domain of unknown function (DUF5666)